MAFKIGVQFPLNDRWIWVHFFIGGQRMLTSSFMQGWGNLYIRFKLVHHQLTIHEEHCQDNRGRSI